MPVPTHQVGNKLVLVRDLESTQPKQGSTVIDARVSSSEQKSDPDRRVARVLTWATGNGYKIDKVVTEVGSALNGHRRKFLATLMSQRSWSSTVIGCVDSEPTMLRQRLALNRDNLWWSIPPREMMISCAT